MDPTSKRRKGPGAGGGSRRTAKVDIVVHGRKGQDSQATVEWYTSEGKKVKGWDPEDVGLSPSSGDGVVSHPEHPAGQGLVLVVTQKGHGQERGFLPVNDVAGDCEFDVVLPGGSRRAWRLSPAQQQRRGTVTVTVSGRVYCPVCQVTFVRTGGGNLYLNATKLPGETQWELAKTLSQGEYTVSAVCVGGEEPCRSTTSPTFTVPSPAGEPIHVVLTMACVAPPVGVQPRARRAAPATPTHRTRA